MRIMQKVINTLALISFSVSTGIVVGGYYLYSQKDSFIQSVTENILGEVTQVVEDTIVNSLNTPISIPSTESNSVPGGGGGLPSPF